VRSRVRGQTSDLRAELRAAAQEARRTATPVGGHEGWSHPRDGGAMSELEQAAQQLRQEARDAWRRHGLTSDQTREILDILTEASARIREVVVRSGR
jgi:hypothetical protein